MSFSFGAPKSSTGASSGSAPAGGAGGAPSFNFGATPAASTATSTPAKAPASFTFGQTTTPAAPPPAAGTNAFSFGAKPAATGAPTTSTAPGNIFGQSQPQAAATPSFSLFGSKPAATGTSSTTPASAAPTTNIFGGGAASTAPKPATSIFGGASSAGTGAGTAAAAPVSFGGGSLFGGGAKAATPSTPTPAAPAVPAAGGAAAPLSFSFGAKPATTPSTSTPAAAPASITPAPATSNIFGQSAAAPAALAAATTTTGAPASSTAPTFSLFGAAKPAASTPAASTPAPSFGATPAAITPAASGTTTASAAGTSLFGAKPAGSSASTPFSLGGGAAASKPLFGAAPTSATTSTATPTATPSTTTSTASAAAAPAASTPATTSAASAATPAAAAPGFSLFGSSSAPKTTAAPATTTTNPTAAASTAASSLFGQPSAGAAASTASKPAASSLFGAAPSTAAAAPAVTAAPASTTTQPAPAATVINSLTLSPEAQRKLGVSLSERLAWIHGSWNLTNPSTCKFLYYFYNNAGPEAVKNLLAQVNGGAADGGVHVWMSMKLMEVLRRRDALGPIHDQLWDAAVRQNPDPSRLIPILAVGFPDLVNRRATQQAESERIASKLAECSTRTDALLKSHTLGNSARLEAVARKQVLLHARVLGLAKRYWRLLEGGKAGLVGAGGSGSLSASMMRAGEGRGPGAVSNETADWQRADERTREILEACQAQLNGGGGTGRAEEGALVWSAPNGASAAGQQGPPLAAKLAELWPRVANLSARRAVKAGVGAGAQQHQQGAAGWAVVDEQSLNEIAQILSSQGAGIAHLTQTLKRDQAIVGALRDSLKGVQVAGL